MSEIAESDIPINCAQAIETDPYFTGIGEENDMHFGYFMTTMIFLSLTLILWIERSSSAFCKVVRCRDLSISDFFRFSTWRNALIGTFYTCAIGVIWYIFKDRLWEQYYVGVLAVCGVCFGSVIGLLLFCRFYLVYSRHLRSGPVGLQVFATAHGQFVGILLGFFLLQDLTYGIYRSNPEMDIGMYVETVNAHFPYELAIVFVCFAFTVVMAILYKSAINDFPQLIQAVVSQYFAVRLITCFYYISLPLLKDYRCEMVQEAGVLC